MEVRLAGAGDLAQVAALANRFNATLGLADDAYDAGVLQQQTSGPGAFLDIRVAADGRTVVGYAISHCWWNPFLARRACWLADLFVDEAHRSRGIGERLMAAVAAQALAKGWNSLWWGVDFENERGRAFYRRLDARSSNDEILSLDEAAMRTLTGSGDSP